MIYKTYSSGQLKELASKLNLYSNGGELLFDYNRARMLLASAITALDERDKYIQRLEKLNDKLLGGINVEEL